MLDLGCGDGIFSEVALASGADLIGIDASNVALERARKRCPQGEFELASIDGDIPLGDSSVDVVWASEVLQHVLDLQKTLSEIRRVLSSGGQLLITVPDYSLLRRLKVAIWDFDDHFGQRAGQLRGFTQSSLSAVIAGFDFETLELKRVGGMPLLRERLFCVARKPKLTVGLSSVRS